MRRLPKVNMIFLHHDDMLNITHKSFSQLLDNFTAGEDVTSIKIGTHKYDGKRKCQNDLTLRDFQSKMANLA
jgi:hypothetical protein